MTLNERINWATGLLVKIHVITGWVIPDGDLMDVLVDQFEKKLNESYPSANPDEVEYAFRSYGTVIKDWGKQMNLALIDEVMIPYMEKRFEVSKVEEQNKTKSMQNSETEITDQDLWEATEIYVNRGNYSVHMIPPGLYEWADKNGNISATREDKLKFIERATLVRHTEISTAYEKNPHSLETKQSLYEFNKMRETKMFSVSEHAKIHELAKKMIVFDMMKKTISKQQ